VEVYVDSLGAFDISAYHATGGVLAKYADLTAALGTNGANIPDTIRKGGMSVKFVLSSDNMYVQYRLKLSTFTGAQFTNTANWQGVDNEPTVISRNLVESGGVYDQMQRVSNEEKTSQIDYGSFLVGILWYPTDGHIRYDQNYTSVRFPVEEGNLYTFSIKPTGVVVFGATTNQSDFISNLGVVRFFVAPQGCHWATAYYYSNNDPTGLIVRRVDEYETVKFTDISLYNAAFNISTNVYVDNQNYDTAFVRCKEGKAYNITSSVANDREVWVGFHYFDSSLTFISKEIFDSSNFNHTSIAPEGSAFLAIMIVKTPNDVAGKNQYIAQYVNNIVGVYRHAPAFMEFGRSDYNKPLICSVGMLGHPEVNLSFNMNYRNGLHKYYEKSIPAAWLAMSSAGMVIQYSAANLEDSGNNDIWVNGGYWTPLRMVFNSEMSKLAVGVTVNDDMGNASIWGDRNKSGGITLAGKTDCVIEGNRIKGQSGIVYINSYNNGDALICYGGGTTKFGGKVVLKDVPAPSSSSDTGIKGEIRYDSNYVYICTATNTWKRVALSDW
jgi:hypothetical protein